MSFIDPSVPPRQGEELDIPVLAGYLKKNVPGLEGDLTVEQFPSGYSNLSYMLRMGDREMVLRRPPVGAKKIKAGHDMSREYRILSKLHDVYSPAPKPLVFCEDESVIGAKFYVMDRIRGIIFRKELPEGLDVPPETARKMCESLVDNLVAIHAIDYKKIGLEDFGKPDGFIERQVKGWAERYENTKVEDLPEVDAIIKWSWENIPKAGPPGIIHNDYKFDNIVLDPNDLTRIIGVLDWEMSTIGDPVFDLGVAISYWIGPDDPQEMHLIRTVPTHIEGALTRKEVVDRYAEKTGRDVSNIVFYYTFAVFKLAVIAQQIYYRFTKGFTKDERFEALYTGVKMLMGHAMSSIERKSI